MKHQGAYFQRLTSLIATSLMVLLFALQPLWAQQKSTEERITTLEAKIAATEQSNVENHRFLELITFVGTIMGFLMGLHRYREGNRTEALRKEYTDKLAKYQEENRIGRESQEAKQDKLIDAARGNIDAASGLFEALGSMLQLQQTATSVGETIKQLENKAEEQARVRQSVVEEQNRGAIEIWKTVDRSNYASIDRQETFHEFAIRLGSRKQEFALADSELNAACHLIAGLDFRVRDVDRRIAFLSKAVDCAERDLEGDTAELIRPSLSADAFRQWNRGVINEALYHLGIVYYNSGDYRQAVPKFEEAITFNSDDLASKIYIPEAKFLGHLVDDFERIAADFQSLADFIDRKDATPAWDMDKKKALLCLLWVRFGNCYYALSPYEPYARHRSLNRALECYKKAYAFGPTSYLAQLSYAQSLVASSRHNTSDSRREEIAVQARTLFGDVFPKVRDKLATTVEPRIRMMLYYMLAICVREGQIEGELPQAYLAQIHAEKANLGINSRIQIFSPRTKNDHSLADFMTEVQDYQSRLPTLGTDRGSQTDRSRHLQAV